ncbi:MAG: hypothetical protein NTZ71_02235 [Planctomycetota bacterium]|nr:hypothetical protein [Planctomycetota bacterium]
MRMTNLYILHTMKLVKLKWFSTVLMKKFPSTPAPLLNNRRTDKPTALPWGFTLSNFESKIMGLGSKFQGVTGDMAC